MVSALVVHSSIRRLLGLGALIGLLSLTGAGCGEQSVDPTAKGVSNVPANAAPDSKAAAAGGSGMPAPK